jgi:hypothetical protein
VKLRKRNNLQQDQVLASWRNRERMSLERIVMLFLSLNERLQGPQVDLPEVKHPEQNLLEKLEIKILKKE